MIYWGVGHFAFWQVGLMWVGMIAFWASATWGIFAVVINASRASQRQPFDDRPVDARASLVSDWPEPRSMSRGTDACVTR
jgi:hypothetical protein